MFQEGKSCPAHHASLHALRTHHHPESSEDESVQELLHTARTYLTGSSPNPSILSANHSRQVERERALNTLCVFNPTPFWIPKAFSLCVGAGWVGDGMGERETVDG